MSKKTTLDNAIDYIETHLNDDIGLKEVADYIGYSYYHMTRVFGAVLGESVGSYIHKRRLYEASKCLVTSNQRVIDIAMECGFTSSEAFSRAFKEVFDVSPSAYRKKGLHLVVKTKRKLDQEHISHITQHISIVPELVETETIELVGLRGTTTLCHTTLPSLWKQYMELCKTNQVQSIGYSICESQDASYLENDDFCYSVMVASPRTSWNNIPKELEKKTLRKGKYAVFTHTGSLQTLDLSYDYIYGVWAMSSKVVLDQRESYEIYDGTQREYTDPNHRVMIYIPIKSA